MSVSIYKVQEGRFALEIQEYVKGKPLRALIRFYSREHAEKWFDLNSEWAVKDVLKVKEYQEKLYMRLAQKNVCYCTETGIICDPRKVKKYWKGAVRRRMKRLKKGQVL